MVISLGFLGFLQFTFNFVRGQKSQNIVTELLKFFVHIVLLTACQNGKGTKRRVKVWVLGIRKGALRL